MQTQFTAVSTGQSNNPHQLILSDEGIAIDVDSVKTHQDIVTFDSRYAQSLTNSAIQYGQLVTLALKFVVTRDLMPNIVYTLGTITDRSLRPINDSTATMNIDSMNIELTCLGTLNLTVLTGILLTAGETLNFNFAYVV